MSEPNVKTTRIPYSTGLRGTIAVPPDKSISHRAALISLLSEQPATIHNYLPAGDTTATLDAVQTYGARVERRQHHYPHNRYRTRRNPRTQKRRRRPELRHS